MVGDGIEWAGQIEGMERAVKVLAPGDGQHFGRDVDAVDLRGRRARLGRDSTGAAADIGDRQIAGGGLTCVNRGDSLGRVPAQIIGEIGIIGWREGPEKGDIVSRRCQLTGIF